MNKKNFKKLIEAISSEECHLNMIEHFNWCGTPRCLAGWSYYLASEEKDVPKVEDDDYSKHVIDAVAAAWLDIKLSKAEKLFYCKADSIWMRYADLYDIETLPEGIAHWPDIPKEMAIEVLTDIMNKKVKI